MEPTLVLTGAAGCLSAFGVILKQIRLNADSKRRWSLARHVFDQTVQPAVIKAVAEMIRAGSEQ